MTPLLRKFITLTVAVDPIREMGEGRAGKRRIIPITGGQVTGEIEGVIQNIGADWQTVYADGTAHLYAQYAFETADGALIEIVTQGFRHGRAEVIERLAKGDKVDPSEYYFRTTATLETGHPDYQWVNRYVYVGAGRREADRVVIDLYIVE